MNKYYAGIGSRETPVNIQKLMYAIANTLSSQGYILRSGGANGADTAFEKGANPALKSIYLPWQGFNDIPADAINVKVAEYNIESIAIARKYHTYFDKLTNGGKLLISRNAYQVLGDNLRTPSEFIVCWTPNSSGSGGTGQAIRIAKDMGIQVYDLANMNQVSALLRRINLHYDIMQLT